MSNEALHGVLRWCERPLKDGRTPERWLQQAWYLPESDEIEWRDVPVRPVPVEWGPKS